jgi:hypothetical protein
MPPMTCGLYLETVLICKPNKFITNSRVEMVIGTHLQDHSNEITFKFYIFFKCIDRFGNRISITSLKLIYMSLLVYTEFILVRLCRKLLADKHTFESVPGTNQY